MQTELLKRYITVTEEKKAMELKAKQLGADLEKLEQVLIEDFAASGVQNMNLDGHTVYMHRQLWASAPDAEQAIAVFTELGLEDLVQTSVPSQRLSAWVREQDKEGKEISEPIQRVIKITEEQSLRVKKSQ